MNYTGNNRDESQIIRLGKRNQIRESTYCMNHRKQIGGWLKNEVWTELCLNK